MRIDRIEGDASDYLEIVRAAAATCVERDRPEVFRVIRIDNWFGERWRGFAGKALGALGIGGGRLRIPPFVPSRVVSETVWRRDNGYSIEDSESPPIHRKLPSEQNLRRYYADLCPETLTLWFSSRSESNGRGSIMVYTTVGQRRTTSWYAEVSQCKDWGHSMLNGITASEFRVLAETELSVI